MKVNHICLCISLKVTICIYISSHSIQDTIEAQYRSVTLCWKVQHRPCLIIDDSCLYLVFTHTHTCAHTHTQTYVQTHTDTCMYTEKKNILFIFSLCIYIHRCWHLSSRNVDTYMYINVYTKKCRSLHNVNITIR